VRGRLKTKKSSRTVPLWPQLAEILTPLLDQRAIEGGQLLFRSPHVADREAPITDLRDLLDRVGRRAGWQDGEVRTRPFRVTYATAGSRPSTMALRCRPGPWRRSSGLPGQEDMYGRIGEVRHRADVVEYRVEQHFEWQGGKWVPKQSGLGTGTIAPAA
jgi:integrase